jgi:hypothetical protein
VLLERFAVTRLECQSFATAPLNILPLKATYSFTQIASVTPTLPLRSHAIYACLACSLNASAPAPAIKTKVATIATLRLSRGLFNFSRHALLPACVRTWCDVEKLVLCARSDWKIFCCVVWLQDRHVQGAAAAAAVRRSSREWAEAEAEKALRGIRLLISW